MRYKSAILFSMCAMLLSIGCGGSDNGTTPDPQPTLVERGWAAFEAGDFADARTHFEQAIGGDATNSAAHNGLGWANMRLGRLQPSVASFDAALSNGFSGAEPHAGKAIVLRDLEPVDYAAAIAAAGAALALDSSFIFNHDTDLDWMDLRLVMAQSYFALGQYTDANAQVGALGGSMQNSASPTFVEDLLAEIERLATAIAN